MKSFTSSFQRGRLLASRVQLLIAVSAGLAVLLVGYAVMQSNAAGFFSFLEPEQATMTGNAQLVSDASAAGGKAIRFGAVAATPPVTTPTPPPPSGPPAPAKPPLLPISGGNCLARPSACGYPDETNTGVQAGVKLTPSGAIVVKTAGTVIANMDVTGSVTINAPNVTIRNTRITNVGAGASVIAGVRINPGGNVTIENSEIDGGKASLAIGPADFTLKAVEIKGGSDAVRADGTVAIYDSYIHGLNRKPDSHNDIIQTLHCSSVTVRHNTLIAFSGTPGSWPKSGDPMNAVYMFGNTSGDIQNVLVENNLVNGGNYTFNFNWTSIDAGKHHASNVRIVNNRFGHDYRFGPQTSMTHGIVFASNAYADTNAAIK
jgi:hypothetical protein